MKWNEIPSLITEVIFDGDLEDKRLHLEPSINWWEEDKLEYEKVEEKIQNFSIERPKYTVYAWCDVSGFNYWIKQQEECNYIQISVVFSVDDITLDEVKQLEKDIDKAYNHFQDNEISEEDYMRLLIN